MSTACAGCGASLGPGQSFCTVCGKQRAVVVTAEPAKTFCTGCGSPLLSGANFCDKCGARQPAVPGPAASTVSNERGSAMQVAHGPNSAATPAPQQPGSTFLKFFMIAVALVMLLLILVMGSCAYIAYRAKQKINEVEQATRTTTSKSWPANWELAPPPEIAAPGQTRTRRTPLLLLGFPPLRNFPWLLQSFRLQPMETRRAIGV